MAKQKKDFSLIIWAFGWLLDVATRLRKAIQEAGVTFEAFERLGTDAGEATLRRVVHVIHEDYEASLNGLPRLNPHPAMSGIVDVPDLPLNELITLAERELGIMQSSWNSNQDVCNQGNDQITVDSRGKRYEYQWVSFGETYLSSGLGWDDLSKAYNPGAFLAWLIKEKPQGNYDYGSMGYSGSPEQRRLYVVRHLDCRMTDAGFLVCREILLKT